MKRLVLSLIIISTFTYAVDVHKFDIKGIKLGMSKKEVLKRMPCKNPKIKKAGYFGHPKESRIVCENKELSSYLKVYTDNYNKVFYIQYNVNFSSEPSWDDLENKFFNKYGKTNEILIKKNGGSYTKSYCWGICSDSYGTWTSSNNKSGLNAFWQKTTYPYSYQFYITLNDGKRMKILEKLAEENYARIEAAKLNSKLSF